MLYKINWLDSAYKCQLTFNSRNRNPIILDPSPMLNLITLTQLHFGNSATLMSETIFQTLGCLNWNPRITFGTLLVSEIHMFVGFFNYCVILPLIEITFEQEVQRLCCLLIKMIIYFILNFLLKNYCLFNIHYLTKSIWTPL